MAYLHRRAPNPYDVILGTRGFMLARDPQTQAPLYQQQKMVSSRPQVTPGGLPYAVGDPSLEIPRGFFNFRSGMGFRDEADNPQEDTNGYYYGLYIAVSSGDIMNGPAVTSVTPTTTGNIRKFFELTVGSTRKLCAAATRYVLVRDADTAAGWVVARDLGAGNTAIGADVFRGTQTRDTAFIAMDSGTAYWTWDGASNTTNFTQDAANEAIAFATYRDRLIKVDAESSPPGYVLRVTYDGGSAAAWGGPFVISDLSNPATDMAVFNNRLYVGTERGLFAPAVADSGAFEFVAEDLTPAFRYQRNSTNGRGMAPWYQYLFVPMGNSLFRYEADGSFDEMGLGALERNSSEVQGVPTAVAGYRNWCLFASFYNAAENASYLMQWGDWQLVETANGPRRVFVPGWYGALYKFAGVQINAMIVTEAPGGNPRLYLGDSAGAIHYIVLPRYSMDWRSDANVVFNTTNPGRVYLPSIHMGIPHEQKANTAIALRGDNLSSARYIDVTYRTNATDAYGGAANLTDSGRFNASPGERKDFTTSVASRVLGLLATLTTTTGATPAVLKAIAAYQVLRPAFKWVINMTVRLGDNIINRDGHLLTRFFGEEDQFDSLESFVSTPGLTRFISPRGEDFNVIVENIQVQATTTEAGKRGEWNAQLRLLQQQSVLSQVAGTYGRIESNLVTYGGMKAAGTYGALRTA